MKPADKDILSDDFIGRFVNRHGASILETLLRDRTTGGNIIWASDEYEALGDGYAFDNEITIEKITEANAGIITPRIAKERERQSQRTKTRAEVFTPSWLCSQMNNDLDAAWFGRRDVFSTEESQGWQQNPKPITFPKKKGHGWHAYVESPRLEITCGEAPFACSRYDAVTGTVLPVSERIGFLDRKLRVVSERTKTRDEWAKWALGALTSSYGFEYQGDSLLIARINMFETFYEHCTDRWEEPPSEEELDRAAKIVSWNFWQMDGLTDAIPTNRVGAMVESTLGSPGGAASEPEQMSFFDLPGDVFLAEEVYTSEDREANATVPLCVIYDWKNDEPFEFASLKGKGCSMGKKFYAVIGNPPYQEQQEGNNKQFAPPIYHHFMDEAYKVGQRVELITPARFLFDVGSTPKAWNRKMLSDPHLKVMRYEANASSIFPNTDIKGGVAVTYHDAYKDFGSIDIFTAFPELTSLYKKAGARNEGESLASIIITQVRFNLDEVFASHPELRKEIGSDGKDRRFRNNAFDKIPLFKDHEFDGSIKVLGLQKNKRVFKYIDSRFVDMNHECLSKWKVLVPGANGSGALGEVLSTPLIGSPLIGYTQSFIAVGSFETEDEANACLKYVKSKFARTLLGILKITQHNDRGVWKYIPLQDFTSSSDIDWSQSVADIDKQLYAKYGLDIDEIDFIESHVKEMD